MSQKSVNGSYWQTPPGARNQILLIPTSLEEKIPEDHPVRLLDKILDWTTWDSKYSGRCRFVGAMLLAKEGMERWVELRREGDRPFCKMRFRTASCLWAQVPSGQPVV